MIDRIHIKNFQSHKDSGEIVLDPNVNVFTGTSDHGKSAIIRALRLLLTNQPSGNTFVSDWLRKGNSFTDNAEVELVVDGHKIIRTKGKDNSYQLDETVYEGFGTVVPEQVTDLLRLKGFNLQSQDQTFYLLDQSSGEVAKNINDMVNMDIIDIAMSGIDKKIREIKSEDSRVQKNLDEWTGRLCQYGFIDTVEPTLCELEDIDKNLSKTKSELESAKVLCSAIIEIQKQQDVYKDIIAFRNNVAEIKRLSEECVGLTKEISTAKNLIASIASVRKKHEQYKQVSSFEGQCQELTAMDNEIKVGTKEISSLKRIIKEVLDIRGKKRDNKIKIRKLEKDVSDLGLKFCPVCGGELDG